MTYRELPDEGDLPPAIIYDVRVRIWHWASVLCMFVLIVSGYFIGTPLTSVAGDTSRLYSMGWIRFAHLACGQVFALLFLYRMFLAATLGGYSRQLFLPTFWRRSWTDGLYRQILWNMMLLPRAPRYLGLNPLSVIAKFFLFVIPSLLTILTGFAMLAEVAGHDSWEYTCFGWMMILYPNTLDLHLIHRLCMWVLVAFVIIHIYTAVREDVVSRQTVVSTMLSGERLFRR